MRHRLRNLVWRELPFSARRAIVNSIRAVEDFERAVYNFWQNLRYSPAWLFVAVTGTAGIVLTVMLFITLSRELIARAEGRAATPQIDVTELSDTQASRWDTRLCLENEHLAAVAYDAEFVFRGKLPPLAISRRGPEPEPEPAPVAVVTPTEERPVERPRLDPLVEMWRQPQQPVVRPEILTAVSEMAAIAERTLTQADGWDRGQPHDKVAMNIPSAYAGDAELNLAAHEEEDDLWTDPTTFPNRSDVALRIQLQTPRRIGIGERGQSEILIRNEGNETLRRIQVSEPIAPLPLVTDAHPGARLHGGLLEREFRRLRPGRERTLGLDWFARDIGDRQHEAVILAEAVVAATVQVEAGEAEPPLETEPAPEEPLVSPPRKRPEPVIEPVETRPRPPEPAQPEPAPVVDIKPVPQEEPVKVVVPPPRVRTPKPSIACKVKSVPAAKVNDVVELKLEVTNNGETPLNDVRIQADVPGSLKHRHGSQLELAVGSLEPGQVHHAVLRVVGQQAGAATATFRVVSAENIKANALGQVAVVAPKPVKTAPKLAKPKMTTPTCPCECDASSVIWAGYEF